MTVNIYCLLTVYRDPFLSVARMVTHLFLTVTFEIGTINLSFLQNEEPEAQDGSET